MTPQIDQLILIDRSVDLITPLATQLTYDGLIDQFFTINSCEFHDAFLLLDTNGNQSNDCNYNKE